jgi:hypothetical protein
MKGFLKIVALALVLGSIQRPIIAQNINSPSEHSAKTHMESKQEQPSNAEGEKTKSPQNSGKIPKIVFDKTSHDFGNQMTNTELKYSFGFKNKGTALLVIDTVKASCGCTAAIASEKEIKPDGEGKIDVTFKAGKSVDPVAKTITVSSNDPASPTLTLEIKATLETVFDVKPDRVYFGQMKKSEKKDQIVEFISKELPKIKISSIKIVEAGR